MVESVSPRAPQQIARRGLLFARTATFVLLGVAALEFWRRGSIPPWLPRSLHPGWAAASLGVWGLLIAVQWGTQTRTAPSRNSNGTFLALDVLALTSILAATGGAENPFTILYFVPLTLATQVSARWTWIIAVLGVAAFAFLFGLEPKASAMSGPHAHHFQGHLRGMWIAFAVSGALMTVFVHRIAVGLDAQRDELDALRHQTLEDRHLGVIGALAAGAAHELGTPLGTIQLIAADLDAMSPDDRRDALVQITTQVERCKSILSRMRTPELPAEVATQRGSPWNADELLAGLDDLLRGDRVESGSPPPALECRQPRLVVEQIVRELLHNALAAHRDADVADPVRLEIEVEHGRLRITVRDQGPGIPADRVDAAFEPLSTSRAEGMGLGLYLSRAHARRLGGELHLRPALPTGVAATLDLPLEART